MTHHRATIRDAIMAALAPLIEDETVAHLIESRVFPAPTGPAVGVYTLDERIAEAQATMGLDPVYAQERFTVIVVELHIEALGAVETAADAISYRLEQLIQADPTLGGTVRHVGLLEMSRTLDDEGGLDLVVERQSWLAQYFTDGYDPSQPLEVMG